MDIFNVDRPIAKSGGITAYLFAKIRAYCASHILVQPNFRRYYFYILPDQAQTHLDHFNVLDEL